jgi:RHS repeat-associated protein
VAETLGYNANITYQYDGLKRLISAASAQTGSSPPAAWTETMQYDGLGNLTAKVLNGTATSIPVNGATNRLSNAYYDANGNMTSGAGATLGYDEANRIVSATEYSGGTEYSAYAPDGKRMFRMEADGVTQEWTFWGARGEKLGTFAMVYNQHAGNSAHPYQPVLNPTLSFAGRTIWDGGKPLVQDRIGTNRATGARYYPFGDEITSTANDATKFGTYHRDGFTGLDYADQRYYASTYGRFNTPDPYRASAGPGDPGSWNRYVYAGGDPVNKNDPTGLYVDCDDDSCSEADCDGDALACSIAAQNAADGGGAAGVSVSVADDGTVTFGVDAQGSSSSDGDSPDSDEDDGGDPVQDPEQALTISVTVNTCVQGAAGLGSVIGAGVGGTVFGTGGGLIGVLGGTLVEPGGGTFVGGWAGIQIGTTAGTGLGTLVGGTVGALLGNIFCSSEHTSNARPSTKPKHQKGQTRKGKARGPSTHPISPPRVRPPGWKGPWPPAPGTPWR